MARGHVLSDSDVAVLKEVIASVRQRRANEGRGGSQGAGARLDQALEQAPEVHVCRVPAGGIPALTLEVGTGSGVQDVPGSAVCEFYHLQPTGAGGARELRRIPGLSRRVYNLDTRAISGGTWVLAHRSKAGHWYAGQVGEEFGTGTGGGGGAANVFSGARVYNTSNITIASATDVALTFNTERYDTDSYHSTVTNTGRLTVPVTDYYTIGASIRINMASTGTVARAWLRLNGSTSIVTQGLGVTGASQDNNWINLKTDYLLTAGDYVEVVCRISSGGSGLAVAGLGSESPEFWVHRIMGKAA